MFANCRVSKIKIPDTVKVINKNAFAYTSNIKNITIPENVTKISDFAFRNSRIESIKIPKSLVQIGKNVFTESNLTSVTWNA